MVGCETKGFENFCDALCSTCTPGASCWGFTTPQVAQLLSIFPIEESHLSSKRHKHDGVIENNNNNNCERFLGLKPSKTVFAAL